MYVKMPFDLMNVGATFQREMDIYFMHELGRFIVIYLDDITIFSKTYEHFLHLRRVFEKCRKFGISLNPKKKLFIGHIISKNGIKIDPSIIKAIPNIVPPRNIK
jgi:hypothetical protein